VKYRPLPLIVLSLLFGACSSPGGTAMSFTPNPQSMTAVSPTTIGVQTMTPSVPTRLTEEEALFQEVIQSDGQFTSYGNNCGKILETEPWCSVVLTVTRVTRPEWTSLFPTTKFFLVKRNVLGQETGFQSNWLIAKQNERQFTTETFDQILITNGVVITDTNREEIAKAFVLMRLSNYVEDEISFSNWGKDDRRSIMRINYNYTLTSWTKIQGLKIRWSFIYYEGQLITAAADLPEYHVGDYIDVPFRVLPPPSQESLEYWNKQ
jgi:hypothetical protein